MRKLYHVVIAALVLAVVLTLPAGAQDTTGGTVPTILTWDGVTGSIGIQDELHATAEVELSVGDQTYRLKVPVTIQIDVLSQLADANLTAPVSSQVGSVLFEPVNVKVIEGAYEKGYRKVDPSGPQNVVVVYTASMTNLHDETVDLGYSSALDTIAVDDTGNSYDEETRVCDEADPGETVTCEFIFDVPATANLVDLKVKTAAYKRFSFPSTSSQ